MVHSKTPFFFFFYPIPPQQDSFPYPTQSPAPATARQIRSTKGNLSRACPLLSVRMPDPAADTVSSRLQKRHQKLGSEGMVVPTDGYRVSSGTDDKGLNQMKRSHHIVNVPTTTRQYTLKWLKC